MSCQEILEKAEQAPKRLKLETLEVENQSMIDPNAEIQISFQMWTELKNLVRSLQKEVKKLSSKILTLEAVHQEKILLRDWESSNSEKLALIPVPKSVDLVEVESPSLKETQTSSTHSIPRVSKQQEGKKFVDLFRNPPASNLEVEGRLEVFHPVVSKRQMRLQQTHNRARQQVPQNSSTTSSATPMKNPGGMHSSRTPRQKLREKVLSSSTDPEVVLNSLLSNSSNPLESQSLTSVASLCFTAPLSAAAKKDPIFAFKKVFKAMTQVEPLDVSLISATTAEIFLPPQLLDQVTTRLSNTNLLIPLPVLSEKDLRRRAASYNRGYFRPLRRASLSGFPTALQLRMLEIAEQSIPNLPVGRQQDVRHAIMMDREWVTGEEM